MNLKEGKRNTPYIVKNIDLEIELERRLEALGLTANTKVDILKNDKKGSLIIKFRGTRFAVGKRIAEHIFIEEASHGA